MESEISLLEATKVRVAGVATESVVDGPGLRCTVFFQGCNHRCTGCHNPDTWDVNGGVELNLRELIASLKLNPLISGVTFSGGEPFLQAPAAAILADYLKNRGLNLWIYAGYTWEELIHPLQTPGYKELLDYADVLVDGPFLLSAADPSLRFRGSGNQRLIKVRESLEQGRIQIWEPPRHIR